MLAATPPPTRRSCRLHDVQTVARLHRGQTDAAATIINAAVFTVGHPGAEMTNLAQVVKGSRLPLRPGGSNAARACPRLAPMRPATARATPAQDPAFDELQAWCAAHLSKRNGSLPEPAAGGHIDLDAPHVVRTENVCLSLTIPKGVGMPANGWPLVIYAHGTGGSFRSHMREGSPRRAG